EKFREKKISILLELMKMNLHSFNQNFLEVYDNSNTIDKYILKNNFYLIKYVEEYVGYMWVEKISLNEYKIIDMYIKLDYALFFRIDQLNKLKNKILIYEGLESYENNAIISNNLFCKVKSAKILKKILCESENNTVKENEISFRRFIIDEDEELRVTLQNKIFYNINRTPINRMDVKFEQKTVNYIEELSIFEYINDIPIGYGQIIRKNNKNVLVNFGVIEEFRGYGLGEKLLRYMCKLGKQQNLTSLYIYVDRDNRVALNLYKKLGFISFGEVSTWIKSD
ncbi:MAG: GNAT family N-acetyltransferase, partial [Clostridium sp.]